MIILLIVEYFILYTLEIAISISLTALPLCPVTVSYFVDELLDFESVTKFMRPNELEEISLLHNFVPFRRTITIDGGISIELAAVCA
jgi:hypothetical protein